MQRQGVGFFTFALLMLVFGGFGFLLWQNAQPTEPLRAVVPTQDDPTEVSDAWQDVLRQGFGTDGTVLPSPVLPAETYAPPTLPPQTGPSPTPFSAQELGQQQLFTLEPTLAGATPTSPPPTAEQIEGDDEPVVVQNVPTAVQTWQPPSLLPPISRDPLGRDHYWFIRPIDSNANNRGLPSYPYGSDGLQADNPSRIHHGIDMSNPIGETVRAAASGTIYFASSDAESFFQNTSSYGNTVVIEHDFGWQGQPIYTLYAHLQAVFVETGQTVAMGDPIGLLGGTGRVTGPHVHFEVRVAGDRYGDTYNPLLWIVPYVGHGTIAGVLLDDRGRLIDDTTVTLRNIASASFEAATSTYIYLGNVNDVNADPNWGENFVFGDVPVGRYEVVATTPEGQRLSRIIDVFEGMTTFVELAPVEPATAEPVASDP